MRWRRNLKNNPSGEERKRPFRRPGWAWLFLLLLPVLWIAFALGHAVFLETDRLRPVRKSVVLPGLPDAFDGFRIAVMSDFHLTTGRRDRTLLQRAVELSNALQPDAVFLLGDFVEGNIPGYKGEVNRAAEELGRLKARDGVFAVFGNHDRKIGIPALESALERQGIHVLENAASPIRRGEAVLFVAGLAEHNPDYDLTFLPDPGNNADFFLLTHYPDRFLSVKRPPLLSFAGHTHGGQIVLPFFGAPVVYSRFGLLRGLEERKGRRIYLTSGIGTSLLRIRSGVVPEVVLITLRSGSL